MIASRNVFCVFGVLIATAVALITTGCGGAGAPVDPDRFVAILVDLHLTESRREIVGDLPPATRDSVLRAHGITEGQYAQSVRYYAERPEEYLDLYNAVIDSLSAELGELEESGDVDLIDR